MTTTYHNRLISVATWPLLQDVLLVCVTAGVFRQGDSLDCPGSSAAFRGRIIGYKEWDVSKQDIGYKA